MIKKFILILLISAIFTTVGYFVFTTLGTVQEPDVFATLDGWGVEPFKGSFEMRGDVELTTSYIDTDEANAASVKSGDKGEIIK